MNKDNLFYGNPLVPSWKFGDPYMPLTSSIIAFILPLGFHGTHIGLESLHGFRGIYWSIFIVIPTKEFKISSLESVTNQGKDITRGYNPGLCTNLHF
jgi:hypothetical protein